MWQLGPTRCPLLFKRFDMSQVVPATNQPAEHGFTYDIRLTLVDITLRTHRDGLRRKGERRPSTLSGQIRCPSRGVRQRQVYGDSRSRVSRYYSIKVVLTDGADQVGGPGRCISVKEYLDNIAIH
jgi:hypothetical protein